MYIYYIYYIGGVNIGPLEGPAWLYAQGIREANISRPLYSYIPHTGRLCPAIYRSIRAAYMRYYAYYYAISNNTICNTIRNERKGRKS